MAKTVREYINDFRHIGEDLTGYQSDDTTYSDKAIWSQIVKSRGTIVKDRDKPNYFSDNMYQTLTCIMFEEVDQNECGLIPPSGCKIMKSTCVLPNMLKLVGFSNQLGTETYDIVRWDQLQGKLNSRTASIQDQIYGAIRNINGKQYLYLVNTLHRVNGTLVAIAEDPIEFAQFCGDKDALCNPLELDIHTDARIQDVVLKLAFETILGVRRSAKADVDNDDVST